ncbi:MAG TPA: hypothetical protein VHE81_05915 [Lacipirellulaceae bacterium]|nr:hypothetical protein [Lacipirellulaceae bacterium]
MTTEKLDELHNVRPFRPFTIHLADCTKHRVVSPGFLSRTQGGRTAYVSTGGEHTAIIDLLHVTKLTIGNGTNKRRRSRDG